jgi:hypothetical protein
MNNKINRISANKIRIVTQGINDYFYGNFYKFKLLILFI